MDWKELMFYGRERKRSGNVLLDFWNIHKFSFKAIIGIIIIGIVVVSFMEGAFAPGMWLEGYGEFFKTLWASLMSVFTLEGIKELLWTLVKGWYYTILTIFIIKFVYDLIFV